MLAHGDSVVKSVLGRRDTLLAMFEVMRKVNAATLLKCLKCLKLLTFDPALLQPLQVSPQQSHQPFFNLICIDAARQPLLPYLGARTGYMSMHHLHLTLLLLQVPRGSAWQHKGLLNMHGATA